MSTEEDWYTPASSIEPLVQNLRSVALSRVTHSVEWRKTQLRAILRLIQENFDAIKEATHADLGQNEFFSYMLDTNNVVEEVNFALDNLDTWIKNERVPTPFPVNLNQPVRSEIQTQPRGLCLVISPWNFPFCLALQPLVAAICAGNACILKPSEVSVHSSRLLGKLIEQYLDTTAIAVVQGSVPQATELLKHRFDAICYTGNGSVGRIVATAAAKHLTPTLLELGGKSPTIVCEDADIPSAAKRIAWGKFVMNMGQACIAPDYVLVVDFLKDAFVKELKTKVLEFFGPDPRQSNDAGRIISSRHVKRLAALLDSSVKILHGGAYDVGEKYMEPTIVEATAQSTVMKEEIFGPILPIITVKNVTEAIEFVNSFHAINGNHPLALYVFAKGKANQQRVLNETLSGGVTVNDTIKHVGNLHLPFGGVGESGVFAYKGKNGFDFFSHKRGVLILDNFVSSKNDPGNWLAFPPYSPTKLKWLRIVGKLPQVYKRVSFFLLLILPCLLAYLVHRNPEIITFIREFNINMVIDAVSGLIK